MAYSGSYIKPVSGGDYETLGKLQTIIWDWKGIQKGEQRDGKSP